MSMRLETGPRGKSGGKQLTPRQVQVVTGLLAGLSSKEMACRLNISQRSVKFHAGRVYRKYRVNCREDLLSKFGRFEITVRWIASDAIDCLAATPVNPETPQLTLLRTDFGPGGTR